MAPQRFGNGPPPWVTEGSNGNPPSSTILIEVLEESNPDTEVNAPVWLVGETLVVSPSYPATTAMSPLPPPGVTPSPTDYVYSSYGPRSRPQHGFPGMSTPTPSATLSEDWQQLSTFTSTSISSSLLPTTSPTSVATADAIRPTNTDNHGFPGDWKHENESNNNQGSIYAAAAVVPVAILAIIGAIAFVCLRRRKRRMLEAASGGVSNVSEIKATQWKPVAQPYMFPAPLQRAVLPDYSPSANYPATSSPVSPPPVILGPIPSGNNGAYLTGIDTSDMVSVTSARDPFADGRSLEEPPPPYRPRSMAPSSIAPSSRHSSVRVAPPPPVHSQTHLIERSPFEDPEFEDNISELSGHAARREADAMSYVSDLSYQNDPVIGRSSL